MNNKKEKNNDYNDDGVYIALITSKETDGKIKGFFKELGIDVDDAEPIFTDSVLSGGLHTSVLFSEVGDHQDVKNNILSDFGLNEGVSFKAKPCKWMLVESKTTGSNVLTLRLYSPDLVKLHNKVRERYGLNHVFDDYTPHISVHYNYKGGVLPDKLPDFCVEYSGIHVKKFERVAPKKQKSLKNNI